MSPPADENSEPTVGQLILRIGAQFEQAELYYGHGTDNALDEAAALVFSVLQLDHMAAEEGYEKTVPAVALSRIKECTQQRIKSREPLAYILREAWFAGLNFYVDERVLVPRSPIAELIQQRFEPWIEQQDVHAILEVGAGSGCIAIACALAFPAAAVTATDISPAALEVAAKNVASYQLGERLDLQQADLLDGVQGNFDIIISNPPYVPDAEQRVLPDEYGFEPSLGLFSGADGLDAARRILRDVSQLLNPGGILVLEVGAQWQLLEQAFPDLPFTWIEFEHGGEGVGLLNAADFR